MEEFLAVASHAKPCLPKTLDLPMLKLPLFLAALRLETKSCPKLVENQMCPDISTCGLFLA